MTNSARDAHSASEHLPSGVISEVILDKVVVVVVVIIW